MKLACCREQARLARSGAVSTHVQAPASKTDPLHPVMVQRDIAVGVTSGLLVVATIELTRWWLYGSRPLSPR